jgi:hypothetical protein
VSLETYAPNNLLVISAGLVFQEEVILKQRRAWRNAKKGFTDMEKNGSLKD